MNVEPLVNVLRQTHEERLATDETIQLSYERLVNKVHLHAHSLSYCLKPVTAPTKFEKDPKQKEHILLPGQIMKDGKLYECRFGFDKPLIGYIKNFGIISNKEETFFKSIARKYHDVQKNRPVLPNGAQVQDKDLLMLRNFPAVNEHCPELSLLWVANLDTKFICHRDQLMAYIGKYVTKSEEPTGTMHSISRAVTARANEDLDDAENSSSVRKVLGKILMKSTERDRSRQECYQELAGISPVTHSLPFKHINVGGDSKTIDLDGDLDAKISAKKNMAEIYWDRETDVNFHEACQKFNENRLDYYRSFAPNWDDVKSPKEVSLHNYLAFFTQDWKSTKVEFVPVISPMYLNPPKNIPKNKEIYERYCRRNLLEFKAGCNPTNILEGFIDHHSALQDFIENSSDSCPSFLSEEFQKANNAEDDKEQEKPQEEEEKEKEDEEDKDPEDVFEDLFIDPNGTYC